MMIIQAENKEEARQKAEEILFKECEGETPEGFWILSIDTREELIVKNELIPGEPPRS